MCVCVCAFVPRLVAAAQLEPECQGRRRSGLPTAYLLLPAAGLTAAIVKLLDSRSLIPQESFGDSLGIKDRGASSLDYAATGRGQEEVFGR
jgi:hypothetical protein